MISKGIKHKLLYFTFLSLVVADLTFSFLQHYNQPLDGDMSWHIIPARVLEPVLENPLGFDVLLMHHSYPNPNRFFSHWSIKRFYDTTPIYLQRFVSPIDSLYLSSALLKTAIQLFLIYFLSLFISGTWRVQKLNFIIASVLVFPLFQTNGYQGYMGIIDMSPTYTFFYALPFLMLLTYSIPLLVESRSSTKPEFRILLRILFIPIGLVCSLSGPLNPGIILIVTVLLYLKYIRKGYLKSAFQGPLKRMVDGVQEIPTHFWFYLIPISLFSLYSLYVGSYNSNNQALPLTDLYSNLPAGIYFQFTQKLGMPILLISILLNIILLKTKNKNGEGRELLTIYKWIGLFSIVYIILLPLGGSREYRPNVLRYDTIIPITFCLMYIFGSSSFYLINSLTKNQLNLYIPFLLGILLIFTYADKAQFDKNSCERETLKQLSESKEDLVQIPADCKLLSWGRILDPKESELNAEFLFRCGITNKRILYFNKH